MSKVIVTRGIQGSGKSTWAKNWVKENPEKRVRINLDSLRDMCGVYWVPSREDYTGKIFEFAVKEALRGGYDIVIDNMNMSTRALNQIKQLTGDVEYIEFFIPLEKCLENNRGRDLILPDKVLQDTWERNKGVTSLTFSRNLITNEIERNTTGKSVTMEEVASEIPYTEIWTQKL